MTAADKKHAIVLALKTWPERSQNELAEQIGCSQRWVSEIKAQVRTTSNLPDRVTGKDGKSYPATRSSSTEHPKARRDRCPWLYASDRRDAWEQLDQFEQERVLWLIPLIA